MLLFSFICIILLKILYALYIKLHAHTFTVLKIWGGKNFWAKDTAAEMSLAKSRRLLEPGWAGLQGGERGDDGRYV